MSWTDTELNVVLVNKVKALRYNNPLNVQLQVIPRALRHEDLIVRAETGSGKTLAYVLPILNKFYNNGIKQFTINQNNKQIALEALIVVPTRVLAQQVTGVLESFNFNAQIIADTNNFKISSPILVATPGKLFNLLEKQECEKIFSNIRFLVLDEADKILTIRELEQFLRILPRQQRTSLLFSATITEGQYLQILQKVSPKFTYLICKNEQAYNIPDKLNCYYLELPIEQKLYYLLRLLECTNDKVVVFTLTCNFTRYLYTLISNLQQKNNYLQGRQVFQLYGKMNARQQLQQYDSFRSNENSILITTDIAARGLDVESLNSVIQLDPPKSLDNFIHRCGRTARNGREGSAIALLTHNETGIVKLLQNKGLPIFAKKPVDVLTSPSQSPLLQEEMDWFEQVIPHTQIKALRKQEKKYERQIQDYINKGLSEQQVRQKYEQVLQQLKQQLDPLLIQEEEQFERERRVYDHPLTNHIREMQSNNPRLFNLVQQTFVSYVRGYKEYELNIILNLAHINLGPLAMSLGLLVLPKVQELKNYYLNFKKWEGDISTVLSGDELGKQISERRKQQKEQIKTNRLKDALKDEKQLLRLLNDGDISEGEFEKRLNEILQ